MRIFKLIKYHGRMLGIAILRLELVWFDSRHWGFEVVYKDKVIITWGF